MACLNVSAFFAPPIPVKISPAPSLAVSPLANVMVAPPEAAEVEAPLSTVIMSFFVKFGFAIRI